jgi:hypothetical protein
VHTLITRLGLITTLVVVGFVQPAEAYIDPGAGGMLMQLVLGSVAAGTVVLHAYWRRIIGVFRRTRPDGKPSLPRA